MSLSFRITAFGQARGPWRSRMSEARRDAVAQGLGEFDEYGRFWLDAPARIEWVRDDAVRKSA